MVLEFPLLIQAYSTLQSMWSMAKTPINTEQKLDLSEGDLASIHVDVGQP